MSKKSLRKLMSQKLSSLSVDEITIQSERICSALSNLPEYQKAQNISYYVHMDKGEVSTKALIDQAFKDGKTVFLPRIVAYDNSQPKTFQNQKSELKMIAMNSSQQVASLKPRGKYQLREPDDGPDCFTSTGLDLIILPGVAFTKLGARLGHGKGFYDSFIAKHNEWCKERQLSEPALIAVALNQQIVPLLPIEEHDKMLDAVISGDGTVYRSSSS